jgi:hypothetical protein
MPLSIVTSASGGDDVTSRVPNGEIGTRDAFTGTIWPGAGVPAMFCSHISKPCIIIRICVPLVWFRAGIRTGVSPINCEPIKTSPPSGTDVTSKYPALSSADTGERIQQVHTQKARRYNMKL